MQKALVTGGNRGIGLEIARGLVAQGMEVQIGVRDIDAGRIAAQQIGAEAVELDLSNPAHVDRLRDVTVLVNNAGLACPPCCPRAMAGSSMSRPAGAVSPKVWAAAEPMVWERPL